MIRLDQMLRFDQIFAYDQTRDSDVVRWLIVGWRSTDLHTDYCRFDQSQLTKVRLHFNTTEGGSLWKIKKVVFILKVS